MIAALKEVPLTLRLRLTCVITTLLLGTLAHAAVPSPSQQLRNIANRYFDDQLRLDPIMGSYALGESRFDGKLVITIAPSEVAKDKALQTRVQREISALPEKDLNATDMLSLTILRHQVQNKLDGYAFPSHLMPIEHHGGLPVLLAQFATGQSAQPLRTIKNYEDFLQRLEKIPAWNEQAIQNVREGVRLGVVLPKSLIERAIETLQPLTVDRVDQHPYFLPIKNFPASFTKTQRERLTKQYRLAIAKRIQPSLVRLVKFAKTDYLPKGRDTDGIDTLPNGKAWYDYNIRLHTTTDMTADAIHNLGLSEVSRIRSDIEKIQATYRYEGSVTQFLKDHPIQPEFRPYKTEKEVLDAYDALNQKVMNELPKLFTRSPKAPLKVLPEPEVTKATASSHYEPPLANGSRPGVFFAVIMDPKKYATTEMTALFLHEGQPGHHFHLAGQLELSLPNFRKYDWITAYGEGWALYAETLGHEMGLYNDPDALLGQLTAELHRAVRLVTDTGLHSKGWTREKTMQYMMETEGVPELEARRSTERYMALPGQAVAYKVGALKIRQLRDRAQATLGSKFSYAGFHEQILSDGALPLSLVERKIDHWIHRTLH
jgi:uncharacterized protein (DUF885 family)